MLGLTGDSSYQKTDAKTNIYKTDANTNIYLYNYVGTNENENYCA